MFIIKRMRQLGAISIAQDILTARNVLLFLQKYYLAQQNVISRLKRFFDLKQKKFKDWNQG